MAQHEAGPTQMVAINPEHGPLHPQNLLANVVNGLARLEMWCRSTGQEASEWLDNFNNKLLDADVRRQVDITAKMQLLKLEMEAQNDATQFPKLWARQNVYHRNKAAKYDESIADLERSGSFFIGIRRAMLGVRKASHEHKAGKAAKLLVTKTY